MSKRFQRWVETWIEENVVPGANADIESNAARAERLTERIFAEAAGAGFSKFEIDEERKSVPRRVETAVSASTEFDIEAYSLEAQLAREHPDGD